MCGIEISTDLGKVNLEELIYNCHPTKCCDHEDNVTKNPAFPPPADPRLIELKIGTASDV